MIRGSEAFNALQGSLFVQTEMAEMGSGLEISVFLLTEMYVIY
jgi:hypothetical protein